MNGRIAFDAIDQRRGDLKEMAQRIWSHPEPPFHEKQACTWIADYLTAQGFAVETGVAGLPTALVARWGSGSPVIGFLGEYDPLPGMSQAADCAERRPVVPGAYGHACGHNLLGTANVGAVVGAKAELEARQLPGTLVFYGCPAEELAAGKGIMASAGLFDELDLCLVFHPDVRNVVQRGQNVAALSFQVNYHGRSAHAGGDPENGRSALKAVELCGIGVQFLREHLTSDVRIHYAITNGGTAHNIIPDFASASYGIRAKDMKRAREVLRRVSQVAQGAALMTETTLELVEEGGCYNTLNNSVLGEWMQECLKATPFEPWSQDDLALAAQLNETRKEVYTLRAEQLGLSPGTQLFIGVSEPNFAQEMASTDAGDVMHIAPGINFGTACAPICAMPHTWQAASAYGGEIGIKGMLYGAKAMALFAVQACQAPERVSAAKEEFRRTMGGESYLCPMSPEGQKALLQRLMVNEEKGGRER